MREDGSAEAAIARDGGHAQHRAERVAVVPEPCRSERIAGRDLVDNGAGDRGRELPGEGTRGLGVAKRAQGVGARALAVAGCIQNEAGPAVCPPPGFRRREAQARAGSATIASSLLLIPGCCIRTSGTGAEAPPGSQRRPGTLSAETQRTRMSQRHMPRLAERETHLNEATALLLAGFEGFRHR